jgi:hypothetical protein
MKMARSPWFVATGLLITSVCLAGTENYGGMDPQGSLAHAGVADDTMVDLTNAARETDPRAADMLFKEGNTIASILDGLKEKGFPIDYKKKNLPPTMTLLALPKATRIDEVLNEILEPWNMSAYHSPTGKWIVKPDKKKATDQS